MKLRPFQFAIWWQMTQKKVGHTTQKKLGHLGCVVARGWQQRSKGWLCILVLTLQLLRWHRQTCYCVEATDSPVFQSVFLTTADRAACCFRVIRNARKPTAQRCVFLEQAWNTLLWLDKAAQHWTPCHNILYSPSNAKRVGGSNLRKRQEAGASSKAKKQRTKGARSERMLLSWWLIATSNHTDPTINDLTSTQHIHHWRATHCISATTTSGRQQQQRPSSVL